MSTRPSDLGYFIATTQSESTAKPLDVQSLMKAGW